MSSIIMSLYSDNSACIIYLVWYTVIVYMTVKKDIKTKEDANPLLTSLESFGLGQNEAKIYLYLLELGRETGGSKIALGTKLHRQYVYNALPTLLNLGLLVEVEKGMQSKYKAVAPNQIEKIAKRKALEAGDLAEQLKKVSRVGYEQDFEVLVGEKAIQDYEMNWVLSIKNTKEDQYIIGGNVNGFIKVMGDSLEEYLINESRENITTYYLGHTSEKDTWTKAMIEKTNLKAKFLEKLPLGVTHFVVRKDHVAFFSFLNPPLVYVIKSEVVAQNYKDFFMMLWGMADGES